MAVFTENSVSLTAKQRYFARRNVQYNSQTHLRSVSYENQNTSGAFSQKNNGVPDTTKTGFP